MPRVRGQEDARQTSEGVRGLAEKGILVSFKVKNLFSKFTKPYVLIAARPIFDSTCC